MENRHDIIVVGSVAFDDIQTIKGSQTRLLGGSGVYFSLAASLFTKVHLIGIVGSDFDQKYIDLLHSKHIQTDYLVKAVGETFSWGGVYNDDFSQRDTLFTNLGVFEHFQPQIHFHNSNDSILFLANIQPSLQMDVINQLPNASMVVMDTMNLWIDNNIDELFQVIQKTDILLINDEEIAQLTGMTDIGQAGDFLLNNYQLKYVIVKKGGAGSLIISVNEHKLIPAIPNIDVFDPTGAGDSFAGGFLGYIASNANFNITDAVLYGTAIASYTVSGFGVNGITKIKLDNIKNRVKLLHDLIEGS